MAKMIGDLIREKTGYQDTHRAFKNDEDRVWKKEVFEEIEDPAHESGMCSDPKTGSAGCSYCDPEWAWLPNGFAEDLEDIEGVTTNMKTLGSYE